MTEHHGLMKLGGMSKHCKPGHQPEDEDRFGRMFHGLSASYHPADVLTHVGRKGGPMDDGGKPDRTKTVPVGHVFFGQFIDHDITLDASSSFERVNVPSETPNVRTPTLDLDCVYGSGPEAHPFLYDQAAGPLKGVRLLTGADMPTLPKAADQTSQQNDLLRNTQGTAIIGDHRNDENRIVSQLQLGIIKFHNHVAQTLHDEAAAKGETLVGHALYEHARQTTTWHYQWSVVNDFLVAMCGGAVVSDILACGRQHYCPLVPNIPIEFAVAAFRFGHSMAPMKIQVQSKGKNFELFSQGLGNGFSRVPSPAAIVDWRELFFHPKKSGVQRAEQMDTKMASELLELPFVTGTPAEKSLATRNLLRGNSFLLPGGDKIAEKMGIDEDDIKKVVKKVAHLSDDKITEGVPLWLYILAEAEVIGRETSPGKFDKGEGLGPVGARIVAEVLIGLLELDEHSYLGANRNWTPRKEWDSAGKILVAVNSSHH